MKRPYTMIIKDISEISPIGEGKMDGLPLPYEKRSEDKLLRNDNNDNDKL